MFDIIPNRKRTRDLLDFDNFFSEFYPDNFFPSLEGRMMRLDIKELADRYIFDVELPGVNKEDIELIVVDDVITINVKKQEELTDEQSKYIRKERRYGMLSRSFNIPYVDTENIKAKFENGILHIILPKLTEQTMPQKRIDID
jgi:HSP20 family protein